jgi:hypothetical protein
MSWHRFGYGAERRNLTSSGDDHFRRWAVVLTCEHASLGVR